MLAHFRCGCEGVCVMDMNNGKERRRTRSNKSGEIVID